jgi:Recombinase zinc beta ribbon domain
VQARRAERAAAKPAGCWTRSRTATRPALLSGLARCARCGSGLVRLTRAHGGPETRRPVHMYGCGRVSRGLPCENRVALEEGSVDQAVLEALAEALSADALEAAVTAALQDARATLAGSTVRRTELDREVKSLEARIGRLTEHLAAGTAVAAPLLAKLTEEEARRIALVRERDALKVAGRTVDLTSATVLRAIRREAENIRGALLEHRDEAREVLAAFISSMRFEPFGQGRDRGYEFHGEGDYGPLLGATSARVGDPSGTPRRRVFRSPSAERSAPASRSPSVRRICLGFGSHPWREQETRRPRLRRIGIPLAAVKPSARVGRCRP